MAMEEMQGVYKRQKTKNDKTLDFDAKKTVLDLSRIDFEISFVAPLSMPLNMAIDETTISLATMPASSEETIAQFEKPSGAKTGARLFPKLSSMLIPPFFV